MENSTRMSPKTTKQATIIGVDVGDRETKFAILSPGVDTVEFGTIATSPESFERAFSRFSCATITLEVGAHSRWASELLSKLGHLVYVANPRQLKLIYGSVDKDDKLDAERLARLTRVDSTLLHPVTHRSNAMQADLEVLKSRRILVEVRTKIINHIRGVLKSFGFSLKKCSTKTFHKALGEALPPDLKPAFEPMLEALESVTLQISELDKTIHQLCKEDYEKESSLLQQVNGVGPIVALNFILTLGNPNRFHKSRSVGAYLGLRPRRSESGDSSPELRITKAGDKQLRTLLIQSAHYILGPLGKDCDLKRWGLRKAEGGRRAKKRAITATARKLAVLLHRLWMTGEVYQPLRQSSKEAA